MEMQDASQDGSAENVNESLGMAEGDASSEQPQEPQEGTGSNETLAVQKRLKAQKRAHEREVRELHARIGDLESRMSQPNASQDQAGYGAPQGSGIDEQIHKAVSYALQHKEMAERKAHEAQMQAHVNRQYQEMQKHLDSMNDKYDDAHEVFYGHGTPYTPAMRDYALTLPKTGPGSAGEVLYKLGKDPEALERIAKLHPLDQASEMAKLSHALIKGGESKGSQGRNPMGSIKTNPVVNSASVTDKTPVSELRARMRAGWK